MALDFAWLQSAVGLLLPLALPPGGYDTAVAHYGAGLFVDRAAPRGQCLGGQRRHLELQVDSIEQRPRDARTIARDLIRRAAAAARGMAKIAAWAWIHRCDQLESCRKYRLARSAGDMDPP